MEIKELKEMRVQKWLLEYEKLKNIRLEQKCKE